MRLLAPPAMTDDRVAQTEGTPAQDRFRTSCPVEARLAMAPRKWDKRDRTALEGSLTEQNLARIRAQNRAFLLPAQPQLTKDNSALLAFGSQDWPVKRSQPHAPPRPPRSPLAVLGRARGARAGRELRPSSLSPSTIAASRAGRTVARVIAIQAHLGAVQAAPCPSLAHYNPGSNCHEKHERN